MEISTKTLELNVVKPSAGLGKLFVGLQALCYYAHEQAFRAFIYKNITSAENVRNMNEEIESPIFWHWKGCEGSTVEVMLQMLAAASFLRQIYEYSVHLVDLVV